MKVGKGHLDMFHSKLTAADRIRATWSIAAQDPDHLASVFYAKLFEIDETTRPLFTGDLSAQGQKLAMTLDYIVKHVDDTEVLIPAAEALARRHVNYGVIHEQYASVGAALIDTFKTVLGDSFSKEDEAAWGEAYVTLSSVMINAAYP